MHSTITEIRKMIEWYDSHSRNAPINKLLDAKDALVVRNYYIAEEFAKFNESHKASYGLRKIGIAEQVNRSVKAGESVNRAEHLATEEKAELIKDEKLNEGIADKLYILLKHSDAVVRAMEQRIAVLRRELENSERENQT